MASRCRAPKAAPAWRRLSSTPASISSPCTRMSRAHLPPYARPLFLRIGKTIETTATFKQKRTELSREGFDPGATTDALYFDTGEAFVPLDAALFARIATGQMRL